MINYKGLLLRSKKDECSVKTKSQVFATKPPHDSCVFSSLNFFSFYLFQTPSIKPAPPPQPKNQVSLSKEFPVSSGSQHRKKEADSVYGEWVPVDKNGKDDGKDDVFPKPAIEVRKARKAYHIRKPKPSPGQSGTTLQSGKKTKKALKKVVPNMH